MHEAAARQFLYIENENAIRKHVDVCGIVATGLVLQKAIDTVSSYYTTVSS